MRYPREPATKSMFLAWLFSGPLNLVVIGVVVLLRSDPSTFSDVDVNWVKSILALSCSSGMAFAIYQLRAAAATSSKIFLTVLTAALLTAAITVVLVFGSAEFTAVRQPSSYPYDLREHLETLLPVIPFIFLLSLFFALPAAIYGAAVLSLVGYKSRPGG